MPALNGSERPNTISLKFSGLGAADHRKKDGGRSSLAPLICRPSRSRQEWHVPRRQGYKQQPQHSFATICPRTLLAGSHIATKYIFGFYP